MKKMLCVLLVLLCMTTTALAGDNLYIANPNPADRLHLRQSPSRTAQSLGKYYNGAPIKQLEEMRNGWVKVQIGQLTGYMDATFLSRKETPSAMPVYVVTTPIDVYHLPRVDASSRSLPAGTTVSVMGVEEEKNWCHLLVCPPNGQSSTAFVPSAWLKKTNAASSAAPVNVYISNPNAKDRLHLRENPSQRAKSMGKYYNGCIGELLSISDNGQWVQVKLYGRVGWMMRKFVYLEGQGQNPTYYGIPTVQTTAAAGLFPTPAIQGTGINVPLGTDVEVLGVVNDKVLHVRVEDKTGFMYRNVTSFRN